MIPRVRAGRLDVHNNVHLMRLRMRHRFRGDSPDTSLITKCLAQRSSASLTAACRYVCPRVSCIAAAAEASLAAR